MSHAFMLVSTGAGAGLTTVSLGMVRALDRLGIHTGFYKPVAQLHEGDHGPERPARSAYGAPPPCSAPAPKTC